VQHSIEDLIELAQTHPRENLDVQLDEQSISSFRGHYSNAMYQVRSKSHDKAWPVSCDCVWLDEAVLCMRLCACDLLVESEYIKFSSTASSINLCFWHSQKRVMHGSDHMLIAM